jgi:hypothetical protein
VTDEQPASTPGWCTNWDAFNTPRLWAMVADEDDRETWKQVSAMGAMADTLKDQRSRLMQASDALMNAWPPDQNEAAESFRTQVKTLLFRMNDTESKANNTAAALGHVLEALRRAKAEIEPLYRQYLEKSDDLVPDWWDHAEDDLDKQARSHMINAERSVAHHAEEIKAPAAYNLTVGNYVSEPARPFASGGGATNRSGAGSAGPAASTDAVQVPHEPPPPLPGRDPTVSDTPPGSVGQIGPGLAGVAHPGIGAAPGAPTPIPSTTGIVDSPGMVIGPGGGAAGGALFPFGNGVPRGVVGGTIHATPLRGGYPVGAKPTPPSWLPTPAGVPGAQRLGRSSGGPVMGLGGPMAQGQGRQRHGSYPADPGFDPDNPWATAEGVDPVIEPSRKIPRHDPGPGVIGLSE